jgi:amylosucrase
MQQAYKLSKLYALTAENGIYDTCFHTRLGANFPIITDLFEQLYASHPYKDESFKALIKILTEKFKERSENQRITDIERSKNPNWFASNEIVGMMLYTDRFNKDFKGLEEKIPYFKNLGINTLHLMPFLDVPEPENDGGYAVKNYRATNPKLGTMEDFEKLAKNLHKNGMNVIMDFVLNHCADSHEWAVKAKNGDQKYKDYFYFFKDRNLPDQFEKTMLEIFPDTAPGNFTWLEEHQEFVMTLFHNYQWDLNYKNPRVLVEMIDAMLFLANKGVDVFRLDAVAYMWKDIGRFNQNLPEVHTLLQIFKLCGQVVAPGIAYIAEAIVAPEEIVKYFGEGIAEGDECDIAYNATFMALSWEAIASGNTDLLRKSMYALPKKPMNTTWINYARCHDDIGLGFEDKLIYELGKNPLEHRLYMLRYYCDEQNTFGRGKRFMQEPNGNARLSGSMASLCGLEKAMEVQDELQMDLAVKRINLQHAIILSLGGIPMIYSGDEIALTNFYDYLNEPDKKHDNRWLHRPLMNWEIAENLDKNPPQKSVFESLKKMIALRKDILAFTDRNDLEFIDSGNSHLLVFKKTDVSGKNVWVIANFSHYDTEFPSWFIGEGKTVKDLISGNEFKLYSQNFIGAYDVLWLK